MLEDMEIKTLQKKNKCGRVCERVCVREYVCKCVNTLHVGALDHARVQVGPVQPVVQVIYGEAVGPAHFIHQGPDDAAVHVGPGDPRPTAPLRPIHVPGGRRTLTGSLLSFVLSKTFEHQHV